MSSSSLSPDEIVQLLEEIQAIMAAGVPMEFGLASSAHGLPRRVRDVATNLASRMENGSTLADAMAEEPRLPQSCRALLIAGIRCGQTQEVLEDVTDMSSLLTSLKQSMRRGMIYPTIVILLSLSLFGFVVTFTGARFASLYEDLHQPVPGWIDWMADVSPGLLFATLTGIGVLLLAVLLSVAALDKWSLFPGARRLQEDMRLSLISHLFSTLLKYNVPLPEAVRLVAQATEPKNWKRRLEQLAMSLEQGASLDSTAIRQTGFPPYLQWMIVEGGKSANLGLAFEQAASHYMHRCRVRAEFLSRVIPLAMVLLIGGGLTGLYALSVVRAITHLWATIGV